jgi:hypothetical protein
MFKCWVYISGEAKVSVPEKFFSDKETAYVKAANKDIQKENVESSKSDNAPYIPGIRRFGFLSSL